MANQNKRQKSIQTSSRQFQNWWTDEFGMINQGEKAVCVLCSGTVVCRTSSVKRHFESNHKSLFEKSKEEQKEIIAREINSRNAQSTSLLKFMDSSSNIIGASFVASNVIAKHGKPFSDGEFIKEAWLKCAPILFEDFENNEKIIQRIKDLSLARNTVKDRILDIASNINQQQKNDINSAAFFLFVLMKALISRDQHG